MRDRKKKNGGGGGGGEAEGGGRGARGKVPNESEKFDELKQSTGTIRLLGGRSGCGLSLQAAVQHRRPSTGQRPAGCHPGRGHLEARLARQLQVKCRSRSARLPPTHRQPYQPHTGSRVQRRGGLDFCWILPLRQPPLTPPPFGGFWKRGERW